MAYVLTPGIKGFSSPLCFKFFPIIPEPASPKPSASKRPILTIARSSYAVSDYDSSSTLFFVLEST